MVSSSQVWTMVKIFFHLTLRVGTRVIRRFVVSVNDETSEDVSRIMDYAEKKNFGWWHWFSNFWLMTSYDATSSVGEIRDMLVELTKNKWVIVIEVNSIDWANYGPQGKDEDNRNISKWLHEEWTQEP